MKNKIGLKDNRWRLAFHPSHAQQSRRRDGLMTDAEMLTMVIRIFSLVIAAVTIGYTIGKKK